MLTNSAKGRVFFCVILCLFAFSCFFITALYADASDKVTAGKITPDPSRLWSPGRLAVDNEGFVYVVDGYKNRVQAFDSSGNHHAAIEITRPSAVSVAPDGTVYIGSHLDYAVAVYKHGGRTGYLGNGKNEFSSVRDLAVDRWTGDVYVVDNIGNAVRVYYASGIPKGALSGFNLPVGIAITDDAVYVLDAPVIKSANRQGTGSRISVYGKSGNFVRSIDEYGSAGDQMIRPTGIAVDSLGNIFVADASRKSVLVYNGTGTFIGEITSPSNDINTAVSLVLSPDNRLYVSSSETRSIIEIGLAGTVSSGLKGSLDFKSKTGDRLTPAALGY
jgi:sugar lactone lactonase YvrE